MIAASEVQGDQVREGQPRLPKELGGWERRAPDLGVHERRQRTTPK